MQPELREGEALSVERLKDAVVAAARDCRSDWAMKASLGALRYLVNGLEVVGGEVRVCQLPAAITPEGLREVRALAALRFDYAAIESEREKLEAAREHDRAMIELWREQRVRLAAVFADAVRDCPDRAHWLGLWNEALEPAALSQATKREDG